MLVRLRKKLNSSFFSLKKKTLSFDKQNFHSRYQYIMLGTRHYTIYYNCWRNSIRKVDEIVDETVDETVTETDDETVTETVDETVTINLTITICNLPYFLL